MTDYQGPERRRFLTVAEVAEMWDVSDDKVRADIKKGALPATSVGGCIRVSYRDALAWGKPKDHASSTGHPHPR
jgi:excisionase family DNA binding protein